MTKKKSEKGEPARGQHTKTTRHPVVIKFKTREGKTIQVKGIQTQKSKPLLPKKNDQPKK